MKRYHWLPVIVWFLVVGCLFSTNESPSPPQTETIAVDESSAPPQAEIITADENSSTQQTEIIETVADPVFSPAEYSAFNKNTVSVPIAGAKIQPPSCLWFFNIQFNAFLTAVSFVPTPLFSKARVDNTV